MRGEFIENFEVPVEMCSVSQTDFGTILRISDSMNLEY